MGRTRSRRFVLFCGGRDFFDHDPIRDALEEEMALGPLAIIEGGQEGADRTANTLARMRGIFVVTVDVKPYWDHFGRAAGAMRNAVMADLWPDRVRAFPTGGPGTANMIQHAAIHRIETIIYAPESQAGSNHAE